MVNVYGLSQSQIEELQSGLLKARITLTRGSTTMTILSEDIVQGGLSVDRYCTSGDKVELGSAVAAALTLKLLNYDGAFDSVQFGGSELFVEVGKDDLWIPCGVYFVDTAPRMLTQVNIEALDRMTYFDELAVGRALGTFPMTLAELVENVCRVVDVPFDQDLSEEPNADLQVLGIVESGTTTWRTVIQHAALLMGTCAYMDREGKLAFGWYTNTGYEISPSNRYMDSENDLKEQDKVIRSLQYTDSGSTYTYGSSDESIQCGGVTITFNDTVDDVLQPVFQKVLGMAYRPYGAGIRQAWFLDPMDGIVWVDKNGVQTASIITHVNYVLNGHTTVRAVGEDAASAVYNRSGMTQEMANALDKVENMQIGGVNLIDLSKARLFGTIKVNDGVLAANSKDVEIKLGG